MNNSLSAVIASPPSGRPRAVLLDCHDYARSVFLQGRPVPWQEPMAYSNFLGQAQGVLKADVVLLPLDRWYAERLEGDPDLRAAMGAKSRTGFALRTLLGDPATTAGVTELVTTVVATQHAPVVVQIPSPMQWLARTHHLSGSDQVLDADNAENASMYVADWLRNFASLALAGVLLDDRSPAGGTEPAVVPLDTYSPVANVTGHYGWTLALRSDKSVEVSAGDERGGIVGPEFWLAGDAELPAGDFVLAEIPAAALPETVLARISSLSEPQAVVSSAH
ncbi:hypothetical protein [Pengzhenrongella sp.]|jgi:hypothetical protein|uniref:hypothetical protein n=1 Tax=Pengzhenrongella sp. TaxID=2888820 RepID=UPI002F929168